MAAAVVIVIAQSAALKVANGVVLNVLSVESARLVANVASAANAARMHASPKRPSAREMKLKRRR